MLGFAVKNCFVDKEVLTELKGSFMDPRQKTAFYILWGICAVLIALTIPLKIYWLTAIFGVLVVLTVIEFFVWQNRMVKLVLDRYKEIYGDEKSTYSVAFEDEQLKVLRKPAAESVIRYEDLSGMVSSAHYLAFFSKSGQYVICQKDHMTEEEQQALLGMAQTRGIPVRRG